ncbi:hypothetical protein [Aquamicrobium terrae]|uniref:Uncharacterized protein n=1 Tax=Aquamicrobium terrae TaxID=1324945 RepID=A0ABV2N3H5_9HYPH
MMNIFLFVVMSVNSHGGGMAGSPMPFRGHPIGIPCDNFLLEERITGFGTLNFGWNNIQIEYFRSEY